jgi:hypothetical protein
MIRLRSTEYLDLLRTHRKELRGFGVTRIGLFEVRFLSRVVEKPVP